MPAKGKNDGKKSAAVRESDMGSQARLMDLLEVSSDLEGIESFDELCQKAVKLARERLGFERLEILLFDSKANIFPASFSIDKQGKVHEHREEEFGDAAKGKRAPEITPLQVPLKKWEELCADTRKQKQCATLLHEGSLYDHHRGEIVGNGRAVLATLWDGQAIVGCLCLDHLFSKTPIEEVEAQLLGLYASVLGRLFSRKMTEEALVEERNLLRTLIDNLPFYIYVKDPNARYVIDNAAHRQFMGATVSDEITGKTAFDFFTPDLAARFHDEDLSIIRAGKKLIKQEESFVDRKGNTTWSMARKIPLKDVRGKTVGILGIRQDVTEFKKVISDLQGEIFERKRVEEALQQEQHLLDTLMDDIPDGIYFKDLQSRFIRINRGLAQKFGIKDPKDAIGKTDFDFFTKDHAQPAFHDEQQVMQTGQPIIDKEEKEVWTDGRETWVSTTKMPFYDKDGKLIGTFGLSRDITQRRRLETAMLQTQKLESLGVLAGGIAHDFNNLLMVILGRIQIVRKQIEGSSPLHDSLESIEIASLRASSLCQQMLAYAGKGRFALRDMNVNQLIKEMNHLLRISVNEDVLLKYHFADQMPEVKADASQIRQVVMNLVLNASEAIGGKEGGVVTISTSKMYADRAYLTENYLSIDLPEGDYVCIEVADNGCGMDAKTRSKIFEPFYTTKFTGRGLGLSAVLGIMRGHKGALKFYTEPGRGSVFKFLLPCIKATQPAVMVQPKREWRGSGTVLIVDDETNVLDTVIGLVESLGFTVIRADGGQLGIDLYRQNKDKIVLTLLDVMMPQVNGTKVFQEIRAMNPNAQVILMSGFNEEEAIDQFIGRGLAGFIQKPFDLTELSAKMQAAIYLRPSE